MLLVSRGGAVEFPDEDSDATQHGVKPLSLTSSTLTLSVLWCVCVYVVQNWI